MRWSPCALCLAVLAATLPRPAGAQDGADVGGQLATLGANALLHGLAAGVTRELRGGSFLEAFPRGTLGGAVAYAGKRVAVRRFDGAGLLGRELAAVGASLSANAAAGRGSLQRLVLPLGPLRLQLRSDSGPHLRIKLDLHSLAWAAYAASRPQLRFDVRRSLSAGAPVFVADGYRLRSGEDDRLAGIAPAGNVLLSDAQGSGQWVTGHELVHVLQYDQEQQLLSEPVQAWLARRLPHGPAADRWLDVDPVGLLVYPVVLLSRARRGLPWEREAYFLNGS